MNTSPSPSAPPPRRLTNWWWDLSLSTKALLVLVPPAVVVGASIVFAVSLNFDQDRLRSDARDVQGRQSEAAKLGEELIGASSDVLVFAITGDDEVLEAVDDFATDFMVRAGALKERADEDQVAAIEAVEATALALYGEYGRIRGLVLDDAISEEDRAAVVDSVATQRSLVDEIEAELAAVDQSFTAEIQSFRDRIDRRNQQMVMSRIAGGVVAIPASAAGLIMFTRSIVKRLRVVGEAARRVMDGGDIGEMEPPAKDEIGVLIAELQRAAGMLIEINAEMTRSRDSALAATQQKDEFLSRMSHELRTPLSAILGFGQLLQMEDLSDEDRDSVDHIVKAGRHLLDLINDLLDISRIATGHLALSLEDVDLADVVDGVVALLRPQAQEQGITMTSYVQHGEMVTADHQRLKQVLLNFLSNAIKYNSPAGTVQIRTEQWDDQTRVSVTDSGAGIGRDARQRLFMPFERLDATSNIEGTGVGLALSKSLVEAMGGTIGVDSVVGRGSTFWVRFPRVRQPDAEAPERPGVPSRVVAPKAADTVLYVEDNLANVRVMERLMRDRDEHLEIAMQGGLAIELTRELLPMVVLLDIHLPDMNGADVLAAIKADPLTSSVPVVILSADATEGSARRLIDLGAHAYLTKPLDIRELTGVLDQLRSERSEPSAP